MIFVAALVAFIHRKVFIFDNFILIHIKCMIFPCYLCLVYPVHEGILCRAGRGRRRGTVENDNWIIASHPSRSILLYLLQSSRLTPLLIALAPIYHWNEE